MPCPTPAQLAYGTATVLLSTLAMLQLSQARSGTAVALVALVGLVLGTLAAMTAPVPGKVQLRRRQTRPLPGTGGEPRTRTKEHSLHR